MLHNKFPGNRPVSSGEEQTMMGRRVFTIYGRGGQLDHVTSIMSSNFHFHVPESFRTKFVQNGTVVSEKIRFEFLYVHDLDPRSRNDIDLHCSHTFIITYVDVCFYQLSGHCLQ